MLVAAIAAAAGAPVVRGWADTGQSTLRYELAGSGADTVVLLHEMGVTLESFDEVVPALAGRHRVLRYDLRGFGLSEKVRGSISMADEVEDLRGLLRALNISGPVTVVGGAIGGSIALEFAVKHPEQTRGLVITSPVMSASPAAPMPAAPANAAPRVDNSPAAVVQRDGVRVYLASQLENVYPQALQTPARVARFRFMQLSGDAVGRAIVTRSGGGDLSADLRAVRTPTLVVSTLLFNNGGQAKAVADAIANAQFVALQTGHYAALESPEMLIPVLLKFLDGLPKT